MVHYNVIYWLPTGARMIKHFSLPFSSTESVEAVVREIAPEGATKAQLTSDLFGYINLEG